MKKVSVALKVERSVYVPEVFRVCTSRKLGVNCKQETCLSTLVKTRTLEWQPETYYVIESQINV